MVRAVSFLCSIHFFAIQIIYLDVVQSEVSFPYFNETHHASSSSGRVKRDLFAEMPSQLKMTVRYSTGEEVELVYNKVPRYLANKHLPIFGSQGSLGRDVMDEIGEFVLYHDVSKCSAAVYFQNFDCLYGVVGMNHYFQEIPFDFDDTGNYRSGVVGTPYILPISRTAGHIHPDNVLPPPLDSDSWFDFLRPPNDSNQSRERPSDSEAGPSTKRQRTEETPDGDGDGVRTELQSTQNLAAQHFYLEIMVFAARDFVDIYKQLFGGSQYVRWIVRYFIIYLNAVDMMLQKIEVPNAKVHINIAKIVFETETQILDNMNGRRLPFVEMVRSMRHRLRVHARENRPDSFDHVLIYTSGPIYDDTIMVDGLTSYRADLYESRKDTVFYNVVPISVVRFQKEFADFVVATHEIGRVLHMNIDPRENGLQPFGQCYGIMQREGPKCDNCLKWSDESQHRLEVFLRENRNRCFLLNEPRSLRPHGASTLIHAAAQCDCFGYHSHVKHPSGLVKQFVGIYGCHRPLLCQKGYAAESSHVRTVIPFDGTPCAKNKVCWKRRCAPTRTRRWPTIQHSCPMRSQ